MSSDNRFYGKYKGTVANNIDPESRGRIQAIVADVQGLSPTTWALPCVPIAGKYQGFFVVPQIGAGVWIEFEKGDPSSPIWVGGFWGTRFEVPISANLPPAIPPGDNIVIQSTMQNAIIISDAVPAPVPNTLSPPPPAPPPITGGIILKSTSGATIVVNDSGIYIHNGKGASIDLIGPSVLINQTAMVVT